MNLNKQFVYITVSLLLFLSIWVGFTQTSWAHERAENKDEIVVLKLSAELLATYPTYTCRDSGIWISLQESVVFRPGRTGTHRLEVDYTGREKVLVVPFWRGQIPKQLDGSYTEWFKGDGITLTRRNSREDLALHLNEIDDVYFLKLFTGRSFISGLARFKFICQ